MPFSKERIDQCITMPEASLLESPRPQDSLPTSLTMKRPAEDVEMGPPSPVTSNAPQHSPMKLNPDFSRPLMTDIGVESEEMQIQHSSIKHLAFQPPKKARREDSITGSEPSTSPHPDDSGMDSDAKSLGEDEEDPNSNRPFPCVWLNGMNGMPMTEAPPTPPPYANRQFTAPSRYEPPSHVDELNHQQTRQEEVHENVENGTDNTSLAASSPERPASEGNMPRMQHVSQQKPNVPFPTSLPSLTPDSKPLTQFLQSNLQQAHRATPPSPRTPSTPPNNPGLPPPGTVLPDGVVYGPENQPMETCPECHKQFKRKVYLQRHMEREHWSTAKVFKCEDCSYETKHQSNLSVHRRIHTGERPYHCGACGQRYTQGHLLKSHIRSRHAGNMELYNLDKKSDSTRGRKSLDMKHEGLPMGGMPGGLGADKMKGLLDQPRMNPLLPPSVSQFMSSMSYMHSLRPLMGSPLGFSGGLLGPRMLGMGGGMMPLPMMNHPGLAPPTSPAAMDSKVHLKVPDVAPGYPRERAKDVDESAPQDLTIKKSPLSPRISPHQSPRSPKNGESPNSLRNGTTPLDLAHSPNRNGLEGPPSMASPNQFRGAPLDFSRVPEPLVIAPNHALMAGMESKLSPDSLHHASAKCNEPLKCMENDLASFQMGLGLMRKRACEDNLCSHATKLRSLRRNIVRMLSVLTPDLSIETGLDCNTDQVDELLHEVIYSNMEDISASS